MQYHSRWVSVIRRMSFKVFVATTFYEVLLGQQPCQVIQIHQCFRERLCLHYEDTEISQYAKVGRFQSAPLFT